jgi:hypothetical protein
VRGEPATNGWVKQLAGSSMSRTRYHAYGRNPVSSHLPRAETIDLHETRGRLVNCLRSLRAHGRTNSSSHELVVVHGAMCVEHAATCSSNQGTRKTTPYT